MANDRLFAVCEWCGDYISIAKYYPSTGTCLTGNEQTHILTFDKFIELHEHCNLNKNANDLGRLRLFSIETETSLYERLGKRGFIGYHKGDVGRPICEPLHKGMTAKDATVTI